MIPPEKILKPEDVHPTHYVVDLGYLISDPVCQKCGKGVYDSPKELLIPCEGKQLDWIGG